jgi:hypothetical protein
VALTPGQEIVTSVVVVANVVAGNVSWQMVCAKTFPRVIVVFDMMIPLQNGLIVLSEKEKATPFESGLSLLHANYQASNGEVCHTR